MLFGSHYPVRIYFINSKETHQVFHTHTHRGSFVVLCQYLAQNQKCSSWLTTSISSVCACACFAQVVMLSRTAVHAKIFSTATLTQNAAYSTGLMWDSHRHKVKSPQARFMLTPCSGSSAFISTRRLQTSSFRRRTPRKIF